jgi:ATP-dependent phosphoenolpyruvate carboxykinase
MSQLHRMENAPGTQFAKAPAATHPPATLYEHAVARGEGRVAKNGPLVVRTGQHTGRSASDKFIVRDAASTSSDWWDNNKPMSLAHFDALYASMMGYAPITEATSYCPYRRTVLVPYTEMRVDCDAENYSAI